MSKRGFATFSKPLGALSASAAKKPRLSSPTAGVDAAIAAGNNGGDAASCSSSSSNSAAPLAANSLDNFDLSAYIASLSTEPLPGSDLSERQLLALECATLDPSWLAVLQDEIRKPYFIKLKQALWKEGVRGVQDSLKKTAVPVFPPAQDLYSWSRYTPLKSVRVCISGQDPYHGAGQAHGLAFSVRPGVKIPPSLRNIYKEISDEYASFKPPKHGNLISWAGDGVLLLNTSLTVRSGQAGSHAKLGWEEFTDKVIRLVDKHSGKDGKGVVFLAWGAWAAKRVAKLDKRKHLVLESPHPSPLSASRGFFGNNHFKKANEWLEAQYGESGKIRWTELDEKAGESAAQVHKLEEKEDKVMTGDVNAVDQ